MKWALLLFLTPLLLHAADEGGPWSQPVKGLRARLFFAPSQEPELDKTFDVMIEFQEVGIDTSLGMHHDDIIIRFTKDELNFAVTDAKGHLVPISGPQDMDMMVRAWDLTLPERGLLTFPIGRGGSKPNPLSPVAVQPTGMPLSAGLMDKWTIPFSGGPYYLSATLMVAPTAHVPHEEPYRGWLGQLNLPAVEIPKK